MIDYLDYYTDITDYDEESISESFEHIELNTPYIMPVLQGQHRDDYLRHLEQYGERITLNHWVGVGSLVGRKVKDIEAILMTIKLTRPDLKLHGFGLGKSKLKSSIIWDCLYSADSSVGGMSKRKRDSQYVDQNNPETAQNYAQELINNQPTQLSLFALLN